MRERLTGDETAHVGTAGAEGDANADLRGPSRDREGHQPVEPDADQRERHEAEDARERRHQPLAHERGIHFVGERVHGGHRHVALDRLHRVIHRPHDGGAVAGGANVQDHLTEAGVRLEEGLIDPRRSGDAQPRDPASP